MAAPAPKLFKFIFTAWIETVTLALKFPCVVSVLWKRGEKVSEVKMRREIEKGVVTFNEQLEIECNMVYDTAREVFEEKKTKFNVLIFSEKGNKQAGEVILDVAELLNGKQKSIKMEKSLEKCPDKGAKLTFTLKGYLKEEIQSDGVSERSLNNTVAETLPYVSTPDFKKKQAPRGGDGNNSIRTETPNVMMKKPPIPQKAQTGGEGAGTRLQAQNKRLNEQLAEIRQLQLQNQNLKRKYAQNDKKTQTYYSKKLEEAKKEYNEVKQRAKTVEALARKKEELQMEVCECKDRMGRILNYAIAASNNALIEEIYNIYQIA